MVKNTQKASHSVMNDWKKKKAKSMPITIGVLMSADNYFEECH